MKNIAVWLDDMYMPIEKPPYVDEWKFCKSFEEFVNYVEDYYTVTEKFPILFALTHDLSIEHTIAESKRFPAAPIFYTKFKTPTGWHAVKWLINFSKEKNVLIGKIALHGNNEKGKSNMMYELQNYKKEAGDLTPAFTMNWKKKKYEI